MNNKQLAVVTGASSGIGKAVAVSLGEKGYHVMLLARSLDKLEQVKSEIERVNGCASVYPLDVTNPQAVNECIDSVIKNFKSIDVLFNNAGIFIPGTSELPNDVLKKMVDVNLLGAMYVGNAVARQMKKQKNGYIINLSSMAGKVASPFLGGYNASKFGLSGYNDALGQEMMLSNVRVTAICPSFVNTDLAKKTAEEMGVDLSDLIQVEDIVGVVKFLLSMSENICIKELVVGAKFMAKRMVMAQIKSHSSK